MKLPRRTFLHLAAGAAALPAFSQIAFAQAYPSRPVHLIVGFPPVVRMTSLLASWGNGYRNVSASNLSLKTGPAQEALLLQRLS